MSAYHPEPYWSDVAKRIDSRGGNNVIAGDDEPYYRYKRQRFLEMLRTVDFKGKAVLEIGSGPGGNLKEIHRHQPSKLVGADISSEMIKVASSHLPKDINLVKIDGTSLPFEDKSFDIVFTATVLQHNTNDTMMKQIASEAFRVSGKEVFLFERIESQLKGDDLCMGRPVSYYAEIAEQNGFELVDTSFINIRTSYYVSGSIRKLLNPSSRVEGEPFTPYALLAQKVTLPVTKILDKIFTSKKDIAKMHFVRK